MLYPNRRPVKGKKLSYAANHFSVTAYRENERTDVRRNCLIVVINALIKNYTYLMAVKFNSLICWDIFSFI